MNVIIINWLEFYRNTRIKIYFFDFSDLELSKIKEKIKHNIVQKKKIVHTVLIDHT